MTRQALVACPRSRRRTHIPLHTQVDLQSIAHPPRAGPLTRPYEEVHLSGAGLARWLKVRTRRRELN